MLVNDTGPLTCHAGLLHVHPALDGVRVQVLEDHTAAVGAHLGGRREGGGIEGKNTYYWYWCILLVHLLLVLVHIIGTGIGALT